MIPPILRQTTQLHHKSFTLNIPSHLSVITKKEAVMTSWNADTKTIVMNRWVEITIKIENIYTHRNLIHGSTRKVLVDFNNLCTLLCSHFFICTKMIMSFIHYGGLYSTLVRGNISSQAIILLLLQITHQSEHYFHFSFENVWFSFRQQDAKDKIFAIFLIRLTFPAEHFQSYHTILTG